MIAERMKALRKQMTDRGIDAYLIPTSDFHESEYVGDHFKCRKFITGFTGSAGTAVITQTEAGLWTDGRYFVQAATELEGSNILLQKMGQEGTPSVEEYLEKHLEEGDHLAFDGRVVSSTTGESIKERLREKKVSISYEEDLIGLIWENRPQMSSEPVWILDEKYAGKPAADKIEELRRAMNQQKAKVHIMTSLDDIAWLLNLRGNDIKCNPVFLSYIVLTTDQFYLFVNEAILGEDVRSYLEGLKVKTLPYNQIYQFIKEIKDQPVMIEPEKINYAIRESIDASNKIISCQNPTALSKAIKNPVEVENMRKAHIKDGVAVTKFIYWLKKNIGKLSMDEISVSDYLEQLRREQEGNLGLSFTTISAYRENAAMCHYSAAPETNKVLKPEGLYLMDSGGQYYEGTTDITRTVALGPLTDAEREHFTMVAVSMLRLAAAKFLYGCRGLNLDYIAREPFWKKGLNFDHGTGHGIGFLLNVHERPNGIRWKMVSERQDNCVLEEGMITSDEPGLYIEGSHGIRTENLIVCRKGEKNSYGQFMEFEHLTFVPIDLDGLAPQQMEGKDRDLLNTYHKQVYEKISPYLTAEESEWLKDATREI